MADSEPRGLKAGRWALAALFGGMTVAHLAAPAAFESMIPRWLPGSRTGWNLAATAGEAASAVLLARRRTAALGGRVAFATLSVVYVANVQAAIDGGYRGAQGWLGTPEAAVARLPLQFPLLWLAYRQAKDQPSPPGPDDA